MASEEMKLSFFVSQATGTDLAISWMIVLNLSSNRKDAMQKFGVGSLVRSVAAKNAMSIPINCGRNRGIPVIVTTNLFEQSRALTGTNQGFLDGGSDSAIAEMQLGLVVGQTGNPSVVSVGINTILKETLGSPISLTIQLFRDGEFMPWLFAILVRFDIMQTGWVRH